jgi:hypothetical protein
MARGTNPNSLKNISSLPEIVCNIKTAKFTETRTFMASVNSRGL